MCPIRHNLAFLIPLQMAVLLGSTGGLIWSAEPNADQVEFFESKIRPVLAEHCYRCHGADAVTKGQLKGGLRIDTRQGLLAGGDSGAAVVPGKPGDSLLIDALRYDGFEMPPAGKLSQAIIADFEKWISAGAADPRTDSTVTSGPRKIDIQASREHWSYRPLPAQVDPPSYPGLAPIDAFIAHRLDAAEIVANGPANRATLIRRLFVDLHGLPPTPEEASHFLHDTSPLAYERLVDRLLASPEYGRHWGRHWLDIVRFAESVTLRGLVQQQAWRFRDYVVDSWNADLPYDQFLREQIAGDLLTADSIREAQRMHIATTFLTLTNANLEDQDKEKLRMDVVDEQLNVIGKAFLAQTIGCARCHDHKFDPIPTQDYYAMAGILGNSRTLQTDNVSKWLDLRLPVGKDEEARFIQLEARRVRLKSQIAKLKKQTSTSSTKSINRSDLPGIVIDDETAIFVGNWTRSTSNPIYVDAGYQHDGNQDKGEKTATFNFVVPVSGEYEVRMSYTSGTNRSTRVDVAVSSEDGVVVVPVNQRKKPPIDGLFVSLGKFQFLAEKPGKVVVTNGNSNATVIVDCVQLLGAADDSNVQRAQTSKEDSAAQEAQRKELAQRISELEKELKSFEKSAPSRPHYMGVTPRAEIGDMPIHIRGNVHQHGRVVPRGFLQIVSYNTPPVISAKEGGRLQMAQWVSDSSNPLPARVIANRIWHWLFGAGLVRTTDNFGHTGEAPSHPMLLDYLSRRLIDKEWSTKTLVREIVLSQAYRRSSAGEAAALNVDPENRLLWRMNRRRLGAESIQDSILLAAGILDRAHGGSALPASLSADYNFQYQSRRRAVYWPLLRNSIPELIATFDGADPSLVVGNRNVSNVATQALFMMNNAWVIEQCELAAHDLLRQKTSDRETVRRAFQRILGREPTQDEEQACRDFLETPQPQSDSDRLDRWTGLVQSLFSTVDFRYRY